jgi:glutamyl-tRNA synthetase
MDREDKRTIRDHVLRNAALHGGVPNAGSVMGAVMSSGPGFRSRPKETGKEIGRAIEWFMSLAPGERARETGSLDPGMLKKEGKKQEELPPLRGAVMGKVVTRFAPSPTGPLSIFQLSRATMLSYLYARKYRGRFIVRIEDTDPSKIELRYYGMIREDLRNVGVKWDRIVNQSDHVPAYYRYAERMMRDSRIYACFCPAGDFRELKKRQQNCPCRDFSPAENLGFWRKALAGDYGDGEVAFRLKTSMADPNPVLRDPPLFRISRSRHPLKGNAYKVWPLYNYSCAIDDHVLGITHVFRGKEHEHNTAVQARICEALGWGMPVTINFGMVYLPGEKFHTRDVAEMIKSGKMSGWDDPRLPTVRSLLRRGFAPEAFRMFALQCGLTKHDINIEWETLYGINRRIIDPLAERYRVVTDPVEIDVSGCIRKMGTGKSVPVQVHPDREERREMPVTPSIFVSGEDFRGFRGREVRLLDLFNVRLGKKPVLSRSQLVDAGMQKLHWVPGKNVSVSVISPGGTADGLGEPGMRKLRGGEIIQMIRMGFGKVERKRGRLQVVFAHK